MTAAGGVAALEPGAEPFRLGVYPTPVERVLATPTDVELWVKRDDMTSPVYGGNKVRKLEYLLADARRRGASRIVTLGATGSHHVLATAVHGKLHGFTVAAVLVPQPRTEHVINNLRAGLAQGLDARPVSRWAFVPFALVRARSSHTLFVPPGGSNLVGSWGYVDAARELAVQVKAGLLPEPDIVVVTLGSGGTAAGLAAGLEAAGLKSRVRAVGVAEPPWAVRFVARRLHARLARALGLRAGREDRHARLSIDFRYLGAGYGHPTDAGRLAAEEARGFGLHVDPTYTSKTFAAALDIVRDAPAKTKVLYWHTLSSAPLTPLLTNAPDERALAQGLARLVGAREAEPPARRIW